MEDLLRAVALGIVQGLTTFLPISSSGHLIITRELAGCWPACSSWRTSRPSPRLMRARAADGIISVLDGMSREVVGRV